MPRPAGTVRHADLMGVAANAALTGFCCATTRAKMAELHRRRVPGFFLTDTGSLVTNRDGSHALVRELVRERKARRS